MKQREVPLNRKEIATAPLFPAMTNITDRFQPMIMPSAVLKTERSAAKQNGDSHNPHVPCNDKYH